MNYKQTAEYIVARKRAEQNYLSTLYENTLKKSPQLYKVEQELKEFILLEAKGKKFNKADKTKLEKQKATILKDLGLTDKSFILKPHCKVCNDTAHFNGEYCACVKKIAINDKTNIELVLHNFKEANFKLYSKDSQAVNKVVFENMARISSKYPNNKKRVAMLYGATGTGKTFLSSCVANYFLEKGFSVTGVTAFSFVNRVLKYHTTFDNEKLTHLTPLLDSDLLIIDDLGTESILKNVTLEYLYTVLNERINSGKLTLITTNLTPDAIIDRYGERIYSRIFDKSLGYQGVLGGDDIRLKSKK